MNQKHFTIMAIIAIIGIAFTFTACPPGPHTHDWGNWIQTTAPTCTTAGIDTRVCNLDATHTETRTGAAALGHDWQWVVTTPATTTADGLETETCTTCGATSGNTRTIAKLEQPEYRETTITVTFNSTDYTAKVNGTLLLAEWNSVGNKLETAIHAAYSDAPSGPAGATYRNAFIGVFGRGATITLVKAPAEGYQTWMLVGDGTSLFLNFAALDNDLVSTFKTVIPKIIANATEMARVMPGRDTLRMAQVPLSVGAITASILASAGGAEPPSCSPLSCV